QEHSVLLQTARGCARRASGLGSVSSQRSPRRILHDRARAEAQRALQRRCRAARRHLAADVDESLQRQASTAGSDWPRDQRRSSADMACAANAADLREVPQTRLARGDLEIESLEARIKNTARRALESS